MTKFTFNDMFTQIKEFTQQAQDALVQAEENATVEESSSVSEACFYMPLDKVEAKVTADWLNVRESPSTDKPRVGQLKRGATITITGVCDDWLSIDLQGNTCYVFAKYTDYDKPKATVTASALNVRKAATTEAEKIGSLPNGTVVNVLGEEKGWVKILHKDALGFVSKEYLRFES